MWPARPAAGRSACSPPGAAPGLAYSATFLAVCAHIVAGLVAGLPEWAAVRGLSLSAAHWANALAGLTLAAGVLLLVGRTRQFYRPAQIAVAALCGALIANTLAHVALSLFTWTVMPGLFTAVILVLPGAGWLVLRLPLSRRTRLRAGLAGAALLPVATGAALLLAG